MPYSSRLKLIMKKSRLTIWQNEKKAVPLHPLFGVTDDGKIGELPVMLRRNDTAKLKVNS